MGRAARENRGHPVKCEFQRNTKPFFVRVCPKYCMDILYFHLLNLATAYAGHQPRHLVSDFYMPSPLLSRHFQLCSLFH